MVRNNSLTHQKRWVQNFGCVIQDGRMEVQNSSEIIASKMKMLTVMVSAIEPLGYKSSSFNVKIANGLIQVWNK